MLFIVLELNLITIKKLPIAYQLVSSSRLEIRLYILFIVLELNLITIKKMTNSLSTSIKLEVRDSTLRIVENDNK